MKKEYVAIGVLLAINLIVTAVFVSILPDQVPIHFGKAGVADRMGSKYMNFLVLALWLGIAILSIWDAKTNDRGNSRSVLLLGVATQVFAVCFDVFIALNQLAFNAEAASSLSFNMSQMSAIALGILLVIAGNLMPKTTMNSTFGIRLPWSTKSDDIWQKTQRLCGYVSIVCGLVAIVCGIVVPVSESFTAIMIVMALWAMVCVGISYVVYKRERG
ncbi:MAG: SdpI family protein [Raoultibacter sp.]